MLMKIKILFLITSMLLSLESKEAIIDNFVSEKSTYNEYIETTFTKDFTDTLLVACDEYNLNPWTVIALMEQESSFNPEAVNIYGTCLGLGQLSTKWHTDRMTELCGEENSFYDPIDNMLTTIDYLHELDNYYKVNLTEYQSDKDIHWKLVFMAYNGGFEHAYNHLMDDDFTSYSENVLQKQYNYEKKYGKLR